MAKAKLTAGRIKDFQCPTGKAQDFLRDTETQGLGVRATVGAKAFIFQSKLKDGSTIRRTIGDVRAWGIDEAKEEARRLQTIIDRGDDPRELDREKAQAKADAEAATEAAKKEVEDRKQYSMRALCDVYCGYLQSRDKKLSARQARSMINVHVHVAHPAISAVPASEVTSDHIATIVRCVIEQDKERAAGILRSYLSAAFNCARKARYNAKLPAAFIPFGVSINPVEPIAAIPAARGERTLTADEVKAYLSAISEDDLSSQALRLALLAGGQRMAQLLRAKVTDYDPQTKTLRLLDGKGTRLTPREHFLPLATKGAALVESLVKRAEKLKTTQLFSSTGTKQLSVNMPGIRCAEIRVDMECEPFNLRDIRRTCETMLASLGVSRDTRAQLLSHGISGVQAAHYDRYEYAKEKRAALVAWEQRLDDIATGKNSANVVQIKRKRKVSE